jgi:hypothetical protein
MNARKPNVCGWQELAFAPASNGSPPNRTNVGRGNDKIPPRLTEIFNRVARLEQINKSFKVPTKREYDALNRLLSQQKPTLEMMALGPIQNMVKAEADRARVSRMKEILSSLDNARGLTKVFSSANLNERGKQSFNRSAGQGM